MDTEDHDHFKTIAAAQVGLPLDSPTRQEPDNSNLPRAPAFCLERAKLLFGSYRKDEVADPEIYCAAIALILSEYPKNIIDYVTDPRTGIASEPESRFGVPNGGTVRAACERAVASAARMAQPRFVRTPHVYVPPVKTPPGTSYFEMFEKHGRPIGRFENINDQWDRGRSVMPARDGELKKSDLMGAGAARLK